MKLNPAHLASVGILFKFRQVLFPEDDQKTIRAYWSKRRVETNGSFQNYPNSLEIVITWFYRKPFYIKSILSYKCYISVESNQKPLKWSNVSLTYKLTILSFNPSSGAGWLHQAQF